MFEIIKHPIIDLPEAEAVEFLFEGHPIRGKKGYTVAAALHQAGYPVHSHSLRHRERSLECGIGKCGACEMLVDGHIRRICITPVDQVKEVREVPKGYRPVALANHATEPVKSYRTTVAIIGAGPAGLAARETLMQHGVDCVVVDNNSQIGGQFLMQTHQFFFFEQEKKLGGLRGYEIAELLAGNERTNVFLDVTVWDILEGKRIACKNIRTGEVFYIQAEHLIVATGAVPFMPTFANDDIPGVYTAAVIQKMMNMEHTLLGKRILTVGAGNIGYLTSYQLAQAGATVVAILEAHNREGGFPVQANRVRRLGIPIILSHTLIEAIPNATNTGITGAIIAECHDFKPVPGTEKIIDNIDAINICTGLVPDDQLFVKGCEVFGRNCHGAGDTLRIGEGTTAVLKGKQTAFEIIGLLGTHYRYADYLAVSKAFIDSQQHAVQVLETPKTPSYERQQNRPFVIADCLYGFACNPCVFACPHGAIKKTSTISTPEIDYDKCTGCLQCVTQCPGLAIFGFNPVKNSLFLPLEFDIPEQTAVLLVDNAGETIGRGTIDYIQRKPNKTHLARIKVEKVETGRFLDIRGMIPVGQQPAPLTIKTCCRDTAHPAETYVCHCDDVTMKEIMDVIGDRKFISVDELKHTTRIGMGACRGKRCIRRLKQRIKSEGITIVGDPTPRGPLSNQVELGDLYPRNKPEQRLSFLTKTSPVIKVDALVAGGGMGGSSLFRYLAENGYNPLLVNAGRGSSWRNIAAGRTSFSVPELSELAGQNHAIFKQLQAYKNIDYHPTTYVTFAHDDTIYRELESSLQWSRGRMVGPSDFIKQISPYINPSLHAKYSAALITEDCWQASPGKVIDLLRRIGIERGGQVLEDSELFDVRRDSDGTYRVLVLNQQQNIICEYETPIFINALGANAGDFFKPLGIENTLYAVKHQAFITRRLPLMGLDNKPLPMLIDRCRYKGFAAVYGQQLAETGQIIGCASPAVDPLETYRNLKVNTQDFLEIVSEVFVDWIPDFASVGFQAVWSGYYIEPRMIIDTKHGIFTGLRGQGFMLSQRLAELYVNQLVGKPVPAYFDRLALTGDGLPEKLFK